MSSFLRLGRFVIQKTTQQINSPLYNVQKQILPIQFQSQRHMSGGRGFISNFIDNLKSEMDKNKDMKDSIKKFREEAQKLEESESLKKARDKFFSIESEAVKGTDAIKQKISDFHEKVSQSEYAKKSKEIVGDVAETVSKAAESMSKQTEHITQTEAYKTVSHSVHAVTQDIKESTVGDRGTLYRAPVTLRKRDEYSLKMGEKKPIQPDDESTGVVLNKETQWQQGWEQFKNNNPLFNKIFDMKAKYEESDNVVVRATKSLTDTVSNVFGGLFTSTELSNVITEIRKYDSDFTEEEFLRLCQYDFIPNILEAINRGDLEILKDWCYEGAYNLFSQPINQAKAQGLEYNGTILDVGRVDIQSGQIMDQGPVIVVRFITQQIMFYKDAAGNVVEGDPDKLMCVNHYWGFCRDQEVFDPKAAWRLLECAQFGQQMIM